MSSVSQRLAAIRGRPTDADLIPFADEIANASATKPQPYTSASAFLRHAKCGLASTGLPEAKVREAHARLQVLVSTALSRALPAEYEPVVTSPYCDSHEAAVLVGVNHRTMLERLKQERWRRLYGWAHFDGHRWLIPRDALMPETRASFLAAQPECEPRAHVLFLPVGYTTNMSDSGVDVLRGTAPVVANDTRDAGATQEAA